MKTIAFVFSALVLFTASAQANFYSCGMLDRGICMEFDVSGVPADEISKGEEECTDNGEEAQGQGRQEVLTSLEMDLLDRVAGEFVKASELLKSTIYAFPVDAVGNVIDPGPVPMEVSDGE
jgi:hypothetical protein